MGSATPQTARLSWAVSIGERQDRDRSEGLRGDGSIARLCQKGRFRPADVICGTGAANMLKSPSAPSIIAADLRQFFVTTYGSCEHRSEERRVGKECVSKVRFRG